MPSGLSLYWLVTWMLWAVVVFLDFKREPRDRRWAVSLVALIAIASVSREFFPAFNLRFALLSGLAVTIISAWGARAWLNRKRQAKVNAWAISHGFESRELSACSADATLPEQLLRRLPIFSRGALSKTEHLISRLGASGRETFVFQFATRRNLSWHGPSGDESRGTVVAIRQPRLDLPFFHIRPDGLMSTFDGGPVGEVVPMATGSRFASQYRLWGHEPRNLASRFSIEALDAISAQKGWIIQGEGEWIVALMFDRSENLMSLKTSLLRQVPLDQLKEHVDQATSLLDHLVETVSRQHLRDFGAA